MTTPQRRAARTIVDYLKWGEDVYPEIAREIDLLVEGIAARIESRYIEKAAAEVEDQAVPGRVLTREFFGSPDMNADYGVQAEALLLLARIGIDGFMGMRVLPMDESRVLSQAWHILSRASQRGPFVAGRRPNFAVEDLIGDMCDPWYRNLHARIDNALRTARHEARTERSLVPADPDL